MILRPASEWATGEPGIFLGVPEAEYHADRSFSNSRATLLDDAPERLKEVLTNGQKPKKCWAFGRGVHSLLLTPVEFAATYTVAGPCCAVTQKGTPCTNGGSVRAGGRWYCGTHIKGVLDEPDAITVVPADDYEAFVGMRARANRSKAFTAIFSGRGHYEVSIRYRHPLGVMIKARADYWSEEYGVVVDYKSARSARASEFRRKLRPLGYHRQAPTYLDGFAAVGAPLTDFVFVPQEKEPPYLLSLYRLSDAAIYAGREDMARLVALYAECVANDSWPGYVDDQVQDIDLTDWDYETIYAHDED